MVQQLSADEYPSWLHPFYFSIKKEGSSLHLYQRDFSSKDFSREDFRKETFVNYFSLETEGDNSSRIVFEECEFKKTNLNAAQLEGLVFRESKFYKANLQEAAISNVVFHECDFKETNLKRVKLYNVEFHDCELEGTQLERAQLKGVKFYDCNLDYLRLAGTTFDDETYFLQDEKIMSPYLQKKQVKELEKKRVGILLPQFC